MRCRVQLDSLHVACDNAKDLVEDRRSPEDVVARARRELATEDADARVAGVQRLARADSGLAGSLLTEVVRLDTSPEVRLAAVIALAQVKPTGVGDVFMALLLNDSDPDVRAATARSLPAFPVEGLELQLQVAARGDPDVGVRQAAAEALRRVQAGR